MMKSLEDFLEGRQSSPSAAFTSSQHKHHSLLTDEACQAANRGLRIFPVSALAKLTGNPDRLIGQAVCEIFRLEELAAEHGPCCDWRVAVDPSLCSLRIDGKAGRDSVAALSQYDQDECLTLQAYRGDTVWAFFRRPQGLVLCAAAKHLAPGLSVLAEGDSCPIPSLSGCAHEISAVPYWLRGFAFETPDNPPGKAAPLPASSPRPAPCRSAAMRACAGDTASPAAGSWRSDLKPKRLCGAPLSGLGASLP